MRTLQSMTMTAALCVLVLATAPARADVEIPAEWIGVWSLETATYDCDTNALLFQSASLDTICPGSVFQDPAPDDFTLECTGSADATSFTTHCEGSNEILPGCFVNFVYDSSGTRNGESYTSTATVNITYTGDCPIALDSCQRIEITGTRIDSSSEPCTSAPVESWSFDAVKALYR